MIDQKYIASDRFDATYSNELRNLCSQQPKSLNRPVLGNRSRIHLLWLTIILALVTSATSADAEHDRWSPAALKARIQTAASHLHPRYIDTALRKYIFSLKEHPTEPVLTLSKSNDETPSDEHVLMQLSLHENDRLIGECLERLGKVSTDSQHADNTFQRQLEYITGVADHLRTMSENIARFDNHTDLDAHFSSRDLSMLAEQRENIPNIEADLGALITRVFADIANRANEFHDKSTDHTQIDNNLTSANEIMADMNRMITWLAKQKSPLSAPIDLTPIHLNNFVTGVDTFARAKLAVIEQLYDHGFSDLGGLNNNGNFGKLPPPLSSDQIDDLNGDLMYHYVVDNEPATSLPENFFEKMAAYTNNGSHTDRARLHWTGDVNTLADIIGKRAYQHIEQMLIALESLHSNTINFFVNADTHAPTKSLQDSNKQLDAAFLRQTRGIDAVTELTNTIDQAQQRDNQTNVMNYDLAGLKAGRNSLKTSLSIERQSDGTLLNGTVDMLDSNEPDATVVGTFTYTAAETTSDAANMTRPTLAFQPVTVNSKPQKITPSNADSFETLLISTHLENRECPRK